jgi:hypothetical protein
MLPHAAKGDTGTKRNLAIAKPRTIEACSRLLVTIAWFVSMIVYVALWIKGLRTSVLNDLSNLSLIVPLIGALLGLLTFRHARKQDRLVPSVFCFGLLTWAIGSMIWMYYNLRMHNEMPYPSLADVGYLLCPISFTAGIALLYWQRRREHVLRDLNHLVPILFFFWSVTVAIMIQAHGPKLSRFSPASEFSKFILDISYPVLDALNLALFFTLLVGVKKKHLKKMQPGLSIVFCGYILLSVADFMFNVMSSLPETSSLAYFNGGPTDAMFVTAFYVISFGLLTMPALSKKATSRVRIII